MKQLYEAPEVQVIHMEVEGIIADSFEAPEFENVPY